MNVRTHSPLWRKVVRVLGRQLLHRAENNDEERAAHNGEAWFVHHLMASSAASAPRPWVVFDGGANMGDYSRLVLSAAKTAGRAVELHAFEPSPRCVETLQRDFGGDPAFHLAIGALSDRTGEAFLHDGTTGSGHASLLPREVLSGDAAAKIAVPLLRLGDYMAKHALTRVDLLKLDIEGSELAALRGLGESLRPDVIDAIQFEYGGAAIDAGTTLRDLYRLLEARGYVVAKLFPTALEVRSYRPWMEHYAYANYVALSPRWVPARSAAK